MYSTKDHICFFVIKPLSMRIQSFYKSLNFLPT